MLLIMGREELDSRKMLILKAIIDDYITDNEPVGSRTIAKKHDIGLSSATIRNEMADLEEMGYLSQPHTSSGRVPSDKAYRLYVDELIDHVSEDGEKKSAVAELGFVPTAEEYEALTGYMQGKVNELSQALKVASELVARLTQYTSFAMTGKAHQRSVKTLQLVPVGAHQILVIVVLDNDMIKNSMVKLDSDLTAEDISRLSEICTSVIAGHMANSISLDMINNIVFISGIQRSKLLPIIDGIVDCIKQCDTAEIYTEGTSKLLAHPEFSDVSKARTLLEVLGNEQSMQTLLESCQDAGGLVVKIGSENTMSEISDCSVVTATYSVNGVDIGTIGVLGPKRMDYTKVISALEYVRKKLLS